MMYYRISKNEKNLFFGKKIAQVWAVTLKKLKDKITERISTETEISSIFLLVFVIRINLSTYKKICCENPDKLTYILILLRMN